MIQVAVKSRKNLCAEHQNIVQTQWRMYSKIWVYQTSGYIEYQSKANSQSMQTYKCESSNRYMEVIGPF